MLTEVSGKFVKIVWADEPDIYLQRGHSKRPPARFNRAGQDALYLSPDEESAKVAIGQYVLPGDPPRVLLTYQLNKCALFDLRLAEGTELHTQATHPWQKLAAAGQEPPSWQAADQLRREGYPGLIDPSRRRPGLWHITLFRWNEDDAPVVRRVGEPVPILVEVQPMG